jgi:hypothetical protein
MDRYAVAPRDWLFSDGDRDAHADRFWGCPRRLVTDGLWAELWRDSETCRGGGLVTSLLPVLALHTWTGKRYLSLAPEARAPGWTTYIHLSHRRIARLAGMNKDSVGSAVARLETRGLLQRRQVAPPPRFGGPPRQEYRLAETLYAMGEDDRWAKLPGNLFYGALWCMLPTPSARHLYVALACLDPVLDEEAMWNKLVGDGLDGPLGDRQHSLGRIRAKNPQSMTELMRVTGMSGSTVEEALDLLRTPLFRRKEKGPPDLAMVETCEAERQGMRCYFPSRAAQINWHWTPDTVNDRKALEAAREQHWPVIAEERDRRAKERLKRLSRMNMLERQAEKARRVQKSKEARDKRMRQREAS